MIQEDQIRAALQRAAEFTPDAQPVRDALLKRAARSRGRRAVLIAGGLTAAATGAAAVAAPVLLRHRPDPPEVTYPNDIPVGTITDSGNTGIALALRPMWLPPGVVERSRDATIGKLDFYQRRSWSDGNGAWVSLLVQHSVATELSAARPSNLRVHDQPAWQSAGSRPDASSVAWTINPQMAARVQVSGFADAAELARRVAWSVTADGAARCEAPMRFGWLPPGIGRDEVTVSASDSSVTGDLEVSLHSDKLPPAWRGPDAGPYSVVLTGTAYGGHKRLTVRGGQGYYGDGGVAVHLDDRWLIVSGAGRTKIADLVRILDELHVGPVPDYNWFRTR